MQFPLLDKFNSDHESCYYINFCLTFSSPNCSFQQDFIRRCLAENPADRPTARDLLLHPSLFEVLI